MLSDLEVALQAAASAATIVRNAFGSRPEVTYKGEVDPVTATDHAAERAVIEVIERARPSDAILAEESGGSSWRNGRVWICDPIDGTVNFLHGFPHVAVSVALWGDSAPIAGVVIDVARNEVFSAIAGAGSFLNGEPIGVSAVTEPKRALITTGFPYDRQNNAAAYLKPVEAVLSRYQGVRRVGSAALDLCWTAAGRVDGYWEYQLKPWDGAAGYLIVEEAGGRVTDINGRSRDLDAPTTIAGNPTIQADLLETVKPHIPGHLL